VRSAIVDHDDRARPTRERILDAAAKVMRDQGLGAASVKAIAREARCSVALLYKYFADQQAIYMGVLSERLGGMYIPAEIPADGDVREQLAGMLERVMAFYVGSFPMSASIFSTPGLLRAWRTGIAEKGSGGPRTPVLMFERFLRARVPEVDAESVAALLVGAAFQAAFLACFEGLDAVPDARARARALVDAVL
jgi:AcrR family transcriptional regulator